MSQRYAQCPRTGDNLDTLLERTMNREVSIKAAGYRVINQWECEWAETLRDNENIRLFVAGLDIVPRLKIRDSFFG
jgi:G:T-mismatch repair DNA endonuclease (very short patch repair protein)